MTQILPVCGHQVVGADAGGMSGHGLGVHRLAVQALLQIAEWLHPVFAQHQKLAVDHALEIQRRHQVGEGAAEISSPVRL